MESTPTVQKTVNMTAAHYAGFWIRFLAMIIDGIIISIISSPFGTATTLPDGTYSVSVTGWPSLIPIVYIIAFWIFLSATPGKLILGLKIVDDSGNKLTPVKAIVRYLGYIVSGIILGIGFFMIGFDAKKQGLHDRIAKTYVVHNK
jgi:uncharacterized RDD family membrane protein YckC